MGVVPVTSGTQLIEFLPYDKEYIGVSEMVGVVFIALLIMLTHIYCYSCKIQFVNTKMVANRVDNLMPTLY